MHGQQNVKSSSGSQVVECGHTDRRDEANSRFLNFANAPKKCFDTDVVLRSNNIIFQEAFLRKTYFISPYITGHEQMSAIIRDVRTYAREYSVGKKKFLYPCKILPQIRPCLKCNDQDYLMKALMKIGVM
jgi:hypothetical protein